MQEKIEQLRNTQILDFSLFAELMTTEDEAVLECLRQSAREVADKVYGKRIFIRGLIEFTNFCKNNCYYCGIRRDNAKLNRYRLSEADILECCKKGYELGFRTFVLQGGEDLYFTDDKLCHLITAIKKNHPDCAVTLSIGERNKESYQRLYNAGADRYLLRHETANEVHYGKLHPKEMSLSNRKQCLWDLKDIGYQVGCGFMVGSPEQTLQTLYEDLQFIQELQPHMVGIGPFIPQKDTPFGKEEAGTMEQTLRLLSIIRILVPQVLLPSTTALGTIHPEGREKGILAGANVVMPNLSPKFAKENYCLYDKKVYNGSEATEGLNELKVRMQTIGYTVVEDRGDAIGKKDR